MSDEKNATSFKKKDAVNKTTLKFSLAADTERR